MQAPTAAGDDRALGWFVTLAAGNAALATGDEVASRQREQGVSRCVRANVVPLSSGDRDAHAGIACAGGLADAAGMTFQTTRWSLVLRARSDDAAGAQALDQLLAAYWQPVYVFFRRLGADVEAAADLTQGLFADLLARGDFATVDPGRGRFRSFLCGCARHWWSHERERQAAHKRGGGRIVVPMARDEAEAWLDREAVDTCDAEALFERRWAATVLDRALGRLEQDERTAGRGAWFPVLRACLDGSPPSEPWATLAARLGSTEGALKVAAHRLKERFRARVTAEVRETLPDTCAPGDELQELLTALQSGQGRGFSPDSR